MQIEDYAPKWKVSTSMALWSVVANNILKVITLVYPVCAFSAQIRDFLEYGSSPFDSAEEMFSSIITVIIVVEALSLLAFVSYAHAMSRFASSQVFWKDERPIRQARSGIVLLTITLAVGILVAIANGFSIALLVVFVCTWVIDIIAYLIIKDGFSQLSQSPHFDAKAQRGASDLKSAANFSIISMVTPFIAGAILVILAVMIYAAASAPSYQAETYDPFGYMEQSAEKAKGIYEATRTMGMLTALFSAISLFVMALFEILVIFLSINGWKNIHKGKLVGSTSNSSK